MYLSVFGLNRCVSNIALFATQSEQQEPPFNVSKSKNRSKYVLSNDENLKEKDIYWNAATPIQKPVSVTAQTNVTQTLPNVVHNIPVNDTAYIPSGKYNLGLGKNTPIEYIIDTKVNDNKRMVANDRQGQLLAKALWFDNGDGNCGEDTQENDPQLKSFSGMDGVEDEVDYYYHQNPHHLHQIQQKSLRYEDIDQSIPNSVYCPPQGVDLIWDLLRQEAVVEAEREPLLVSFLYSTILNHPTLESALAFHLANRLQSASMDSIQIMNLVLEALQNSPTFRRSMRADIIAVRDRDPACTCLPDVFLHFKGFHALQSYRVAHHLWKTNRKTLAHYVQSQMSQNFQIDIHPNATILSGIMLDHGTGIVIGETAHVGYNCSILHHVTLGGSGKRGVDRHPKVGNNVLLGAGATVLGNIEVGDGCQVGAGTLVIESLPQHSVAVGVPGRVIGQYKEQDAQPSRTMNQVGSKESEATIQSFDFMGEI
jgi:serine O-acetyltransferase